MELDSDQAIEFLTTLGILVSLVSNRIGKLLPGLVLLQKVLSENS